MDTSLLVPAFGNLSAVAANAHSRLPLTPFFFPMGDESELLTRDFGATDFIPQNQQNPTGGGNFDLICGHKYYQVKTAFYDNNEHHLLYSGCEDISGTKTIITSYAMVFNETLNTVSVAISTDTTATGVAFDQTAWSWETDTRTQDTISLHFDYDSGDGCTARITDATITLTDEITAGTIDGWLTEWGTKSYTFRQATDIGTPVRSSYSYISAARKTESSEAGRYRVSGGEARTRGAWFTDAMASGMVGSLASLWNGNFTVMLCLRRRKNAPVIYAERTKVSYGGSSYGMTAGTTAVVAYPNGSVEEELEDSTANFWASDFQVFEWNPESDPAPVLDQVPLRPQSTLDPYSFFTYSEYGSAVVSQLTFISRTGAKYRITLELGTTLWDEELGDVENWHTRVPLETSAATLQTTYRVDGTPWESDVTMARIFSLEIWTGDEENPWTIIAEHGHEFLPSPDTLVGDKITDPAIQILMVSQSQSGYEFGFSALDGSGGRYRKRTYRCHRTTPDPGDAGVASCGGDYPAGALDYEYVEEYVLGQLQPKNITELTATVDTVDWASDENIPASYGSLPGDWDDDVLTATLHRVVRSGIDADYGYSAPKLDMADAQGEILETVYVPLAVAEVDGENITDWTDLLPPAAGSTVFVEGQRLIYTP